jgi:hypothetical protein
MHISEVMLSICVFEPLSTLTACEGYTQLFIMIIELTGVQFGLKSNA